MTCPEGFQLLETCPEVMVDLLQCQQSFRLHQQTLPSLIEPASGQPVEVVVQLRHG